MSWTEQCCNTAGSNPAMSNVTVKSKSMRVIGCSNQPSSLAYWQQAKWGCKVLFTRTIGVVQRKEHRGKRTAQRLRSLVS